MALSNHERVGKALEVFNVGLCPFVEREFKAAQGDEWFEKANAIFGRNQLGNSAEAPQWDTASLLPVMWDAWNEVIAPHPDVASGKYQQAEFAADLWQVYVGEGSAEYRDPAEFYRRTYLTAGLKDLLARALLRLSG